MQGLFPPSPMSFRNEVESALLGVAGVVYILVWLIRTARKRKLEGPDIIRCALVGAPFLLFLAMGVYAILWPSP